MKPLAFAFGTLLFFAGFLASTSQASLIYLYDFPGTPGSGSAAAQTNAQPSGATFSDFTRTNLTPDTMTYTNEFTSVGYAHPAQDLTQYAGFTITAKFGQTLDLTSLTFDTIHHASGPTKEEVHLYLNGDYSTPYATQFFSGTKSIAFNFTPLTNVDNVTSAEFRFYGWNAGQPAGSNGFSNVAVNGAIGTAIVPEVSALPCVILLVFCLLLHKNRRRFKAAFDRVAGTSALPPLTAC